MSTPPVQQSQPCLKPLQQVQLRHSGNQNSLAWAFNTPLCLGTAPGGRYAPPPPPPPRLGGGPSFLLEEGTLVRTLARCISSSNSAIAASSSSRYSPPYWSLPPCVPLMACIIDLLVI